ncbi:MAG: Uncharacterized protein FD147_1085 [Chloroflexi bacterium]|nr:MAG: Uncharacterized protein FD147_1085 [Chloroflexota bacterium]
MMVDILCPICKRINDSNTERCWYCQAILGPDRQAEKNQDADWLSPLRDDSNQKNDAGQIESSSENGEVASNQEEVPDWLARIRNREQFEQEAHGGDKVQDLPAEADSELPDWLREIKAGNSDEKKDSLPDESLSQPVSDSSLFEPKEQHLTDNTKANNEDDTEEWLNQLAAWKPAESKQNEDSDKGINESLTEKPFEESFDDEDLDKGIIESPPETTFEESRPTLEINIEPSEKPIFEDNAVFSKNEYLDDVQELKPQNMINELPTSATEEQKTFDLDSLSGNDQPDEAQERTDSKTKEIPEQPKSPEPAFDFDVLRVGLFTEVSSPDLLKDDSKGLEESSELVTLSKKGGEEDWLTGFQRLDDDKDITSQVLPVSQDETSGSAPFLPNDLPDWLTSESREKPIAKQHDQISEEIKPEIFDGSLEKAQLPAWLQAMRPVESVPQRAPSEKKQEGSEKEGPLAGIAGTLQSAVHAGSFHKPVSYGSALKVSERQKTNANLIASLVEETISDQDVAVPVNQQFKRLSLRFLLAFLMITLVVLANISLRNFVILPVLFPAELVSTFDVINSLPVDKPVLLAADFEAGLSGELNWSSQTLFEHFMRRNLTAAVVSTNPVGSAILSGQLESANHNVAAYSVQNSVVNLGYLAGGSTALQFMTEDLRSAIPYTQDLLPAWVNPVLQNVHIIKDFGAVVVITDKAESARVWIEQVQPSLGSTPLLFVVSAQAAPLVQPYYQSGQVAGFISGFNGSLAYEQIIQQPGVSTLHLSSYQLAILFVVILLLIGGLISWIRPVASV